MKAVLNECGGGVGLGKHSIQLVLDRFTPQGHPRGVERVDQLGGQHIAGGRHGPGAGVDLQPGRACPASLPGRVGVDAHKAIRLRLIADVGPLSQAGVIVRRLGEHHAHPLGLQQWLDALGHIPRKLPFFVGAIRGAVDVARTVPRV